MSLLFLVVISVSYFEYVAAIPNNSTFQHCIDPRTMKKHPAYTEWADVYSCTRHRCQPRGRNLAIYTVGCKKVEPPESAIECEEVVEDTNMQFPYCCTRLRCLVLVRGEVWTRVLGQPWEKLPAAPWSHMYKMKRPPPSGEPFGNKANEQGPVYELLDPETERHDKVQLRSGRKFPDKNCNEPHLRTQNGPDLVLALATEPEHKDTNNNNLEHSKKLGKQRTLRSRLKSNFEESDAEERPRDVDVEEEAATEAPLEPSSQENAINPVTHKSISKSFTKVNLNSNTQNHDESWLSDSDVKWKDRSAETEAPLKPFPEREPQSSPEVDKHTEEKPTNLQALVDAIGTRMKDIEHVVQKMSDKVHLGNRENAPPESIENGHVVIASESDVESKQKRPSDVSEHYKRFPAKGRNLKYPKNSREVTSELPIYIEDRNINGYFSDPSNTILRRTSMTKEPTHPIYMAPVEPHHKQPVRGIGETSDEKRRKHRTHKKKHGKGKVHKKHHKDDRRKKSGKLSSGEMERNTVSLEESEDVF